MVTNKIISIIISITAIPIIPLQMITTFVLGILVSLTFGLLLIPISFIWTALFLLPILWLSHVYEKIAILRPLISVIGIPLVVLGNIYTAIMPSMGEMESRHVKMLICQTFPYSWRFMKLQEGKDVIEQSDILTKILRDVSKAKPLSKYLDNLRADVVSRPYYMNKNYQLDW